MASAVATGAKTASRGAFKGAWAVGKIGSFVLLFAIVVIAAAAQSWQEHSAMPLIKGVGGKIFLSLHDLKEESQRVIEKGGLYDGHAGKFHGIVDATVLFAGLALAVWIVLSWLRFFAKVWANGPFSFPGNPFANAFMGAFLYVVIYIIAALIIFGAIGQLNSFQKGIEVVETPFVALGTFWQAAGVILQPLFEGVEGLPELNRSVTDVLNQSVRGPVVNASNASLLAAGA